MIDTAIAGGCFCGAVRYGVRARPIASMLCHCRSCTRIAGAPAVAWVTFAADAFAIRAGAPATLRSSSSVERTFCHACGTPLTYRHADHPDEIDVATCTLDDGGAFPPTYHAWESEKVPWLACPAHVPTCDGAGPPR
jgi:hypothetical protein